MRRDTRFKRPPREDIESRLPENFFSDAEVTGIWNMMLQADDPSEVARWYRTYRDSEHCSIPVEKLRLMRDTMILAMREVNKEDPSKRLEKKRGIHYEDIEKSWYLKPRTGA